MTMVIIALLPCIAASLYFFGLRVLLLIAISYAAGGLVEVVFAIVRKEDINEGFLVTGMLFPLVLPPNIPWWMVVVGVIFGVLVGKELFGGTGRNLFNPAILGRCFLALAYPKAMAGNWLQPVVEFPGRLMEYVSPCVDAVTAATPLGAAKKGEYADIMDLLIGNVSGSIGETSAIAIIAGGIFLLLVRVANWRTVAGALSAFAIMAAIVHLIDNWTGFHFSFPALTTILVQVYGSIAFHILAGGLLFGVFFMATDPVTSPVTNGGKWIYGILIGVITVLVRNFTGYVEGMMFAILLGNICAPVLDEIFVRFKLRRLRHVR